MNTLNIIYVLVLLCLAAICWDRSKIAAKGAEASQAYDKLHPRSDRLADIFVNFLFAGGIAVLAAFISSFMERFLNSTKILSTIEAAFISLVIAILIISYLDRFPRQSFPGRLNEKIVGKSLQIVAGLFVSLSGAAIYYHAF